MFKRIAFNIIKKVRLLLKDTPVQRWKITWFVYGLIFRTLHRSKEVTTEYKGVKLVMPTNDTAIVPSIVAGFFESLELDVFKELAKNSSITLDVGANIGLYSIIAGKANLNGMVYSFEPVPANIEYIEKNAILNRLNNVEIQRKAVGDRSGQIDIYLSETNVGNHSAVQAVNEGSHRKVKVAITTLDQFVSTKKIKPDLLKVDVEGYDGFVYQGSKKVLQNKPTLLAEYNPSALEASGFSIQKFIDQLFGVYKNVYIFNESLGGIEPISKSELANKNNEVLENILLIDNPAHIKVAKKFLVIK